MTKEQRVVVKRVTKPFKGKGWTARVLRMDDVNVVVEMRNYVSPPKELIVLPNGDTRMRQL